MRCHVFVLSLLVVASNNSNASLYSVIKTGWKIYEVTRNDLQNVTTDIEQISYEICDKYSNDSLPNFAFTLSEELVVLNNYLVEINTHCKLLLRYNRNYRSMIGFARSLISNDVDSVMNLIQKVHSFFSKPKDPRDSILSDVDLALKNMGTSVCSLKDSPSQSLVRLIDVFAGAEIKGFALVQFSYALLNYYDDVNYREWQRRYRTDFKFRLYKIIAISREVIAGASKDVWRCDPKVHGEGRTYEQFTKFLQGYIQHELFLNEHHSCSNSCESYYNTTVYKYGAKNIDQFSKYQECPGKVLHCQSLHAEMSVCPSKIGSRRYDFVRYSNGEILGRRKKCSQRKHDLSNWLVFILFGYECSYCFCFCEGKDKSSDRLVSMRSSLADINNNRVVTGVRFAKKNKMIHIQVQEGKLIRHGRIDKDTVRWVPLTNFSKSSEYAYLYQDYYRLTPETCTMYLDDVIVNPQHIVTGLRFKMLGIDLVLEILISPYDFETGQLIQPYYRSMWKDNLSTVEIRQEILLEEPDIPTIKGPPQHVYNKRSKQSIRFTSTDVKKDLAQTTVPFFDAQPVSSETPAPLEGIGIFHKGRKGSGGFVAMKLITFDYSQHIPNEFSRGTE